MGILDRLDPVFIKGLGYLCPAPFPSALDVEQVIEEETERALKVAKEQYNELQRINQK